MEELIGQTLLLYNYRGDGLYRMIEVQDVRDTHDKLLSKTTLDKAKITRGRYLIIGKDVTRLTYRSYYLDFSEFRQLGLIGRLWHGMMVGVGLRREA